MNMAISVIGSVCSAVFVMVFMRLLFDHLEDWQSR